MCAAAGITRLGDLVDHIKRIRDGGQPTDDANLQTLCNKCHNAKRQAERLGIRVEGEGGSNL